MEIETDELLTLLSERVQAEQARTAQAERTRSELHWLFKQQEYLLATIREVFEEMANEVAELKEIILSSDYRYASLRRQLAANIKTLSDLEEERALRGGEVSVVFNRQIEMLRDEIENIKQELGGYGKTETDHNGQGRANHQKDQ